MPLYCDNFLPLHDYGQYGSFAKKTRVGAATGGPVAKCPSILSLALLVVLTLGSCNALVYKIMYQVYGSDGAFFVSTGVNVLYIIYGGLLLYPRMLFTDSITPAMKALPKRRFIIMGFLDCCGTFLAAMGAVYTPGSVQTLLNQTLIPTTMIVSACFLRTHFSNVQLAGAALVLMGAAVTVLPAFVTAESDSNDGHGASPSQSRWYANLVFFASNLPVACSQVVGLLGWDLTCVSLAWISMGICNEGRKWMHQTRLHFHLVFTLMATHLSLAGEEERKRREATISHPPPSTIFFFARLP